MAAPYSFDKYLAGLRSFGPWLTKRGAVCACGIGLAIAWTLVQFNCFPQHMPKAGETVYPWWQLSYFIGFPLVGLLIWLILSQIYLRTGRGVKIGVAYDSYGVDIGDWKRTRVTLAQLLKSNMIKGKVSLRFIPQSKANTAEAMHNFMKRYGFAIVTMVQRSAKVSTEGTDNLRQPFAESIQVTVASEPEYAAFLKTTFPAGLDITRKRPDNLIDIIDGKAHNFHDALILFVGTLLYFKREYDDAAIILRHLDISLSHVAQGKSPRVQVRFLDMRARLARTQFSVAAMPDYDALNAARQYAETTLCYFDEFPDVATSLGRIRFLVGDLDGTIELTDKFAAKVLSLKGQGYQIADSVWARLHVNVGFLSFVQGYWDKTYDAYNTILTDQKYHELNWADLVDFADHVASLDRYDGIVFLQAFYRKVANDKIPERMLKGAQNWVNADTSRRKLKPLLNRCYPAQSAGVNCATKRKHKNRRRKKRKK